MSLSTSSIFEPITEPEILESIKALPTEDDLPYDDGEPMESERHLMQMIVLIQSLREGWSTPRSYYVGGNMFLYYELNSEKKFRGPDFFLVLDVNNRERKSWVVWQEGMRFPDLIIEILSDKTREIDKGEKKELYERIFRTPEYYLFDPFTQEFIGLKLRDGSYEEEMPDEERKIYSKVTGLYLVIKDGWLRWMTPEGIILPTPSERADQEKQRADQEKQRADQAEQRLKQVEQLLEEYKRRFGSLEE